MLKLKHERAEKLYKSMKKRNPALVKRYKNAKKKLTTALSLEASAAEIPSTTPKRRKLVRKLTTSPSKKQRALSKDQLRKRCLHLSNENGALQEKLEKAQAKIKNLEEELNKKEKLLKAEQKKNTKHLSEIYDLQANQIDYTTLTFIQPNSKAFEYLCGIDLEKFNLLYDCIEPYTHLIPYPDDHKVTKFS